MDIFFDNKVRIITEKEVNIDEQIRNIKSEN